MNQKYLRIREGIIAFEGKMPRNLLFEPIVSNTYFIEDRDEVIIFDPSCGKKIGERIEAHIKKRHQEKAAWEKGYVIAGHSHLDHANNFYLSSRLKAGETHIYVHESGFKNGKVMNVPAPWIEKEFKEIRNYYNPFLSFFPPYNWIMYPMAALDFISTKAAIRLFSTIGALPFPLPENGNMNPEPLKSNNAQLFTIGGIKVKGWQLKDKVILSTPGHTPCSISLFWPERKALFLSDADWVGNPVFMSSSVKDCISSLGIIKDLTDAGNVDILLPAHGSVKEGKETVVTHLEFHIKRLEAMRNEVLSFYQLHKEKDIRRLTKKLIRYSPLFGMLKHANYPRFVLFVHNMVGLCLKEDGLLPSNYS